MEKILNDVVTIINSLRSLNEHQKYQWLQISNQLIWNNKMAELAQILKFLQSYEEFISDITKVNIWTKQPAAEALENKQRRNVWFVDTWWDNVEIENADRLYKRLFNI